MASITLIEKNAYHDSVTLMSLSGKVLREEGVEQAVVSMATAMNKDLLNNIGLLTEEAKEASENDLIIAVKANSEQRAEEIVAFINNELTQKSSQKSQGGEKTAKTIDSAINMMPDANFAVISVPGEYAAREARQALNKGLHVLLFSDNVSITAEKELKELGQKLGLFVMGPDCGTAIINQVGLCFANKVSKGGIGLVGASGTGLQEVTVQIDRLGYGITQAIGTGGRDLSDEIGGIMMLEGLKALERDEATKVITLISKPPAPSVEKKILAEVKQCQKPVVICFLDGDAAAVQEAGVEFAPTLMEAARKSVTLLDDSAVFDEQIDQKIIDWVESEKNKLAQSQKYIRGLFCGGTLTSEALSIMRPNVENLKSNVALNEAELLPDVEKSVGNTLLDLGDDEFTKGRPHPMIEPSLRLERIVEEAKDPDTAVILLDFELGYGSNDDPVGTTVASIQEAQAIAKENGRNLPIIAYICGTLKDKQDIVQQKRLLEQSGVLVAESNEMAAQIATMFVK